MILRNETIAIEGGFSPLREKAFGIAPAAMGHLMSLLSNMYSDPYRAVAREYISNAVDSCRLARYDGGTVPKPIEICIPTKLNPTFSVRDYGGGMTEDETSDLLSNFGASGGGKRKTNALIGCFGTGGKVGLAVTDSYTFSVWHGGYERVWLVTVKADAAKCLQLLTRKESSELPGVRVDVPISLEQVSRVKAGVDYTLECLDEPVILNGEKYVPIPWDSHQVAPGIQLVSKNIPGEMQLSTNIVVGDFEYPIPYQILFRTLGEEMHKGIMELESIRLHNGNFQVKTNGASPTIAALLRGTCMLKFEGGTMSPTPNRENIIFDTEAEKLLKAAFDAIQKAAISEIGTITSSVESNLEVLRLIRAFKKAGVKSMVIPSKWKGKDILIEELPVLQNGPGKVMFPVRRKKGPRFNRTYSYTTMSLKTKTERFTDSGYQDGVTPLIDQGFKAVNGKLYTINKFVILQAEPMRVSQLNEIIGKWWSDSGDIALKLKQLKLGNDVGYLIVSGTEVERKAKIQELDWCIEIIAEVVLRKPPVEPRAHQVLGAPRTHKNAVSSRGWTECGARAFEACLRPDPGPIVYVVDRPVPEIARSLWVLSDLWDVAIPGFKGTKIYALTEGALESARSCPEYAMVSLYDALGVWLNAWCEASPDTRCFGAEIAYIFGYPYLKTNTETSVPDEKVDPWKLIGLSEFVHFMDNTNKGIWWSKTYDMEGPWKKLVERLLLRTNTQGTRVLESEIDSVCKHLRLITSYSRRLAGSCEPHTLSETACKSLQAKIKLLQDPLVEFTEGKPERVALLLTHQSGYRMLDGASDGWEKAMFAQWNRG